MDNLNFYELCGYISGFLFAFSLIPQIYKSCKTKKLNDISYCWLIIFLIGMILLLIYSYHENLKPVFIPASFEGSFMVILLFMKIYYHKENKENKEINNNKVLRNIENP